jgi:26S proteasome regulatory subunit N10
MPLESCMILLDCSQFMRNGDYFPTRLEAQQDAANLLIGAKTQSHAESTVGVSAGTELLVSPSDDIGKILGAVHRVRMVPSDKSDICASVAVASLALKHRRNKNGAQRIVLFVGTPVATDVKSLQKAGRQLKKNNVAIDVVALGELEANEALLQELVDAANGRGEDAERTCHLVCIPAGVLPSDVLASSPILASSGGAFAAAAAAGGFGTDSNNDGFDFGGIDPNMDPELAMALRVSMEEERARQERAAAAAAASSDAEMAESSIPAAVTEAGLSMEEEALLQQALAMSMNENEQEEDAKPSAANEDEEMEDDDAAMQMALQMSMGTGGETFQDPNFVNEMLQDMSDADANDPDIQEMLKKAAKDKDKNDKE